MLRLQHYPACGRLPDLAGGSAGFRFEIAVQVSKFFFSIRGRKPLRSGSMAWMVDLGSKGFIKVALGFAVVGSS